MHDKTDQELLADFAERGGEAAFSELVRRHVDLVHSAALRLVVDRHLAEDVSQTVFAALAKQARDVKRKVAQGMPLSGWLHVTTRNIAAKAVRAETRRRLREQEAAAMREISARNCEPGWGEIAPYLDHSLAELAASDRDALLLRFFESKTAREIGEQLGLSEEAAQKRVIRALDRLRIVFAARGLAIPSTALAALIGAHAVKMAPAALAGGISQFAVAAGVTGAMSAGVSTWFAHFASQLAMTKVQTSILIVVGAAAVLPIGLQQIQLNQLHAELAATRAGTGDAKPALSESSRTVSRSSPSDVDEIARLRREAERLRLQIAARRGQAEASSRATPGVTLLKIGQSVPFSELVFAGNGTPAAALQSMLTFERERDIEAYFNMSLLSPLLAEEMNQMMQSAEKREEGIQHLDEEVRGIAAIEILAENRLNERRTQVVYKAIKQNDVSTNTAGFGLTSRGWLQLHGL